MADLWPWLAGFLALPGLIGLFVIWHVARGQRSPADTSNRINKIRLLWFALTREDKLAPHLPWLRRDEWENVNR